MIKGLVEKGIVKCQTHYFWFGGNGHSVLESIKVLRLRNDIEDEVPEIITMRWD
jgi:hypothetical protein